ncbi:hypothetical protein H9Y04_08245 [Streptomyces sp. TRM66268-LWL]|uniref:Uncharacterized protein n=1 Tax=Streptomyces polyasparticus TaxID=2767826 RepID=A0ABR7SC59_9ACTN|nr:hypothetical protein [Streptomyces polyasparticus]MBC9712562.1 hypothetical protein [Streptomyces polyasparticus]
MDQARERMGGGSLVASTLAGMVIALGVEELVICAFCMESSDAGVFGDGVTFGHHTRRIVARR